MHDQSLMLYCLLAKTISQGGGTLFVQSLSTVKLKIKGQLELFFTVNGQATITL